MLVFTFGKKMPFGRWLLDLIFPRDCFVCQRPLDAQHPGFLCDSCFGQIVFPRGSVCSCCGRAMETESLGSNSGEISTDASARTWCCSNCVELQPFFRQGISLFAFTNVGRAFIHTLKYRHGTYLKKDLRRILEHEKSRLLDLQGSTFVPVPLHFFRQWKRGYNQSEWIAKALVACIGGKIAPILRRNRFTPSQTSLTRSERKQNVKGAFDLRMMKKVNPHAMYVLVDDVFTTGATLNACAQVLYEHGAQNIRVFTLAHG